MLKVFRDINLIFKLYIKSSCDEQLLFLLIIVFKRFTLFNLLLNLI